MLRYWAGRDSETENAKDVLYEAVDAPQTVSDRAGLVDP